MTDDANPDLSPRPKKPNHVSSGNTVGNFADFCKHKTFRSPHPPPVWDEFDAAPDTGPTAGPDFLPALPCGTYEVDEPGGSTVPVRVRRRRAGRYADQYVVEWLLGHDGRTWEPFAAVLPGRLDVWPHFRKTDYGLVAERLYQHVVGGECFDGWEFRLAKPCCARCGRELKKADEVPAGIHATCREKWGSE